MKKFKSLYLVLTAFYCSMTNAQTEEQQSKHYIIATFEIKDARHNDEDITNQALKSKAALVLYRSSAVDSILFSNYWGKTQSYGAIYSMTKSENPIKESENKSQLYTFYWSYYNSNNQKEGTAKVKLLVVYKSEGNYFEITVLPENLDELVYKGQMYGDLAILEWNCNK